MLAFVSEFHYPVRMNAVSGLVKESLPNYLQALPIPNTVSDIITKMNIIVMFAVMHGYGRKLIQKYMKWRPKQEGMFSRPGRSQGLLFKHLRH